MIENNKAKGGDGSVNVAGQGNAVYHFSIAPSEIRRSYIFEVCLQIIETDIPIDEKASYSLGFPSNWDEKLEYNQVKRYANLFHEEIEAYNTVDEIMAEFPNRAKLIENIRSIYRRLDDNTKTGDIILDNVFDELLYIVDGGDYKPENKMYHEDKVRAIKLVMFYTITKCQLLKRVNQ